ncbi:MAG TPA: hypothetical protein VER76_09195 [Pyrinomonadaceae bacterium]|nr:hypothetical protein [Pyrinomonadaceae bacterium]
MHDCRQTEDNLIDLIFDEADAATRSRLLREVEACGGCGAQYRSLKETLAICDEAAAAAAPSENYWPQYHQRLSRRLLLDTASDVPAAASLSSATNGSVPFWTRLLKTSIRVPAPLAAAAILLLVASSVLALTLLARPAPEPVVVASPDSSLESAPQIKFIEVPVVREKIITQTVYLPRRGTDNTRRDAARENIAGVRRQNAASPDAPATPPVRANLSGFKPAGEVNLRIIKGSDAREQ